MKRLVTSIRFRTTGTAEALSSTPDLSTTERLLAATGAVERVRASDVYEADGGWVAVVRPWVTGAAVPLPSRRTRAGAIDEEVTFLSAALGLPA